MNQNSKTAYRTLLYLAMLDIRAMCWWQSEELSDEEMKKRYERSREAGALAYWLHNMAISSAHDFVGFNEEAFWHQHKFFCSIFPDSNLKNYRPIFEDVSSNRISLQH